MAYRQADLTPDEGAPTGSDDAARSATARIESEIRTTLAGLDETVAAIGWRMRHGTPGERAVARSLRGLRHGWISLWDAVDRWPVAGVGAFFAVGVILGGALRGRR